MRVQFEVFRQSVDSELEKDYIIEIGHLFSQHI